MAVDLILKFQFQYRDALTVHLVDWLQMRLCACVVLAYNAQNGGT